MPPLGALGVIFAVGQGAPLAILVHKSILLGDTVDRVFAQGQLSDNALRCAGKLDSDACGEDALELQPSPFDWNDTVGFVI